MELEKASVAPAKNTLSSLINEVLMERHAFCWDREVNRRLLSLAPRTGQARTIGSRRRNRRGSLAYSRTSAGAPSKDSAEGELVELGKSDYMKSRISQFGW